MPEDLRARIAAALRRHDANMNGGNPAHDADEGYDCCADAVMAVLDDYGPDELDRYIREQAMKDPAFAAAYVRRQEAGDRDA
jgi:hypothetical protein